MYTVPSLATVIVVRANIPGQGHIAALFSGQLTLERGKKCKD